MVNTIKKLEEIDINEFLPRRLVCEKLPKIGYHGVKISGFQGLKHLEKDIRAIGRFMDRVNCLFEDEVDKEKLTYTLIPVNVYGEPVK